MTPGEYPRRVLLAALGLTPQVLTETVYALATAPPESRWVPTDVQVITTAEGADRAKLALLSPSQNWFGRLCRELGLEIRFDESGIHVLRGEAGIIDDIRTEADNVAAADQIAALVEAATRDPNAAVHVSLAGGRKTMGFFLGYAISLYGREQDRLSHVLVSAPYESHPGFFYPTRESGVIFTQPPDSRPLDTSRAKVTLAEIPFVRLRPLLEGRPSPRAIRFAEAIAAAQSAVRRPELTINPRTRTIRACGETLKLAAAEAAFLTMHARRAAAGLPGIACPGEACEPELARAFLAEYERWSDSPARTRHALRNGMDRAFFLQRRARLSAALRAQLGFRGSVYEVRSRGKRPNTRYGLELEADQVRLEEDQ